MSSKYIKKILPINLYGGSSPCEFSIPRRCPLCGIAATFSILFTSKASKIVPHIPLYASIVFECPECGLHFLLGYEIINDSFYDGFNLTRLVEYENSDINLNINVPDNIQKLSPNFYQIYKESLQANAHHFNTLYGMGLRKSLEYLIKDWFISIDPETNINVPLSQLINKIKNEDIKTLALASAWLGNDEAHTTRKYPDKNANDLLAFIDVLITYISGELKIAEAKSLVSRNN